MEACRIAVVALNLKKKTTRVQVHQKTKIIEPTLLDYVLKGRNNLPQSLKPE